MQRRYFGHSDASRRIISSTEDLRQESDQLRTGQRERRPHRDVLQSIDEYRRPVGPWAIAPNMEGGPSTSRGAVVEHRHSHAVPERIHGETSTELLQEEVSKFNDLSREYNNVSKQYQECLERIEALKREYDDTYQKAEDNINKNLREIKELKREYSDAYQRAEDRKKIAALRWEHEEDGSKISSLNHYNTYEKDHQKLSNNNKQIRKLEEQQSKREAEIQKLEKKFESRRRIQNLEEENSEHRKTMRANHYRKHPSLEFTAEVNYSLRLNGKMQNLKKSIIESNMRIEQLKHRISNTTRR